MSKMNNYTKTFVLIACLSSIDAIAQEKVAVESIDATTLVNNELIRKQQLELEADGLYYKAMTAVEDGSNHVAITYLQSAKEVYLQAQSSSNRLVNKVANVDKLKIVVYNNLVVEKLANSDKAKESKSFDLAKTYLKELIELDPDNEKLYKEKISSLDESITQEAYRKLIGEEQITEEELVKQESVDVRMQRAQVYFDQGEYSKCREELEDLLLIDKFNIPASHLLFRTFEEIKTLGKQRNRVTQKDLLAETSWKWEDKIRVSADLNAELLNSSSINVNAENVTSIHERLRRIYIPSVSYDGDGIESIVEDLIRKSKEFDPDPEGKGVNIVYFASKVKQLAPVASADDGFADEGFGDEGFGDEGFGDEGDSPVAAVANNQAKQARLFLSVEDMQLGELINQITDILGLKIKIDKHAVYIADQDYPLEETETVFFDVPLSMIDVVGDAGAGLTDDGLERNSEETNWQSYFTNSGVTFPAGSKVAFVSNVNRLVVTNTAVNIQLIKRIIDELGRPSAQISVETKFIDVDFNSTQELGFMWRWTGPETPNHTLTGDRIFAQGNGGVANAERFDNNIRGIQEVVTSQEGPVQLAADLVFGNQSLQMMIRALDQTDTSELLTSPNAVTQSGNTVVLRVVQERFFPEEWEEAQLDADATIPTTPTFGEARDIGVILEVTPEVSADNNTISLDLNPQQVEFISYDTDLNSDYTSPVFDTVIPNFFNYAMPIIAVRQVETRAQIWDGETLLIGGLVRENVYSVDDSIPYISDIPYLGRFFQSKGERSEKSNLLIFVTGRLISPVGTPYKKMTVRGLPDFKQL
ncbi:hypothetical protein PQO03_09870 [Lentisphaera profundi]|uniref:Type II/III secretion system secretin-like domain-containing protein n=1 Tax=Lentisphaera profundi TaxID=1658616 RepID=A0ABY7VPF0_9BACT|nr:hypothetical protein [Lentisphaera profundi]WDE96020.1 hypothetical protein PQO03_09870 [Lentisphaera profundi]